ncbi:ARF/SAR superfamily [Histomonas meleagridis]|nr:ARF/SAR superfamily [Histomonas meleagridis]
MGGCSAKPEYRILMLGIGAAGKTTILYRLKKNEVVHTVATVGFTMETVHFGDLEFCVWDLGGQDKIRPLWRHYFNGAQGVIFVVDSSDKTQFATAKQEFHQIVQSPQLKGCPILIFANKQDIEGAVSVEKLSEALDLQVIDQSRYHIEASCALTGLGLVDGMNWLSDAVVKKH